MKTNTGSAVVSELLSPATINLNLKSADRESVLAELVNQIPQLAGQPEGRETLLRALHEREELYSTGIGDGIALPHSRNALVGLVDRPVMVFGRHAQGIPGRRDRCRSGAPVLPAGGAHGDSASRHPGLPGPAVP